MRSRGVSIALQFVLLAFVLFFITKAVAAQWNNVSESLRTIHVDWWWVTISCAVVLLTYAALVESWRMLLRASGDHLPFTTAVRIWTVSNLGRYVPGKVWSVGALGLLARGAGVSGVGAASAAILGTLLNLGAGFGIAVVAAAGDREHMPEYLRLGMLAGAAVFLMGVAALPWLLPVVIRLLHRFRRTLTVPPTIPLGAVYVATVINACSWVTYGIAFGFFARAVTPNITGDPLQFITVFTASYLAGYVVLFLPGGIGVRESAAALLLVAFRMATPADAILLAFLSRLWLTVLEILPGLIGLLFLTPNERQLVRSN